MYDLFYLVLLMQKVKTTHCKLFAFIKPSIFFFKRKKKLILKYTKNVPNIYISVFFLSEVTVKVEKKNQLPFENVEWKTFSNNTSIVAIFTLLKCSSNSAQFYLLTSQFHYSCYPLQQFLQFCLKIEFDIYTLSHIPCS